MVAKRKPTAADMIDRLARQVTETTQMLVPLVRLPDSITNLESLMEFDRVTCLTMRQFVRPLHAADFLDPRLAQEAGVELSGGTVLVTQISPGIRTRVITEGPKPTTRTKA